MTEFEIDPSEISETTQFIPYEEWHPPIGPMLWKRLEVPNQHYNGSYKNPAQFDYKDYWDTEARYMVSHHDRLEYWNKTLSVAFVVEHYVQQSRLGAPSPKVLEVGTWPMYNSTVSIANNNTVIGVLSSNKSMRVVGVDNVDITRAIPYRAYTPPNFGDSIFINDDIHKDSTKAKIVKALKGQPHVIVGNKVFEKNIGRWSYLGSRLTNHLPVSLGSVRHMPDNLPEMHEVSEELAIEANSFLGPNGVLIICNGVGDQIPDFVHTMPLLGVYLDEYENVHTQVRGKI